MEADKLKQHFDIVASTESGAVVLRWLMDWCGYQKPARVLNPQSGEINLVTTACNAALMDVWLTLRQYISTDKLMRIEYNQEPQGITVEGDLDGRRTDSSSDDSSASSVKR